ncbi:MAG: phage scaffolding protein [Lachnospiraceae bacterium]|nr:phage scaffolding protein [Lachnospiraceae bacterium]
MALTKNLLVSMGIEPEKISTILDEHEASMKNLRTDRDAYKEKAEKFDAAQSELDTLKASTSVDYKTKFENLQAEYDKYKTEQKNKETATKVREGYKQMLKDIGVSDKRIESVLKVTDLSGVKLDKDGGLVNKEELETSAKTEWADFIATESKAGATTTTPPATGKAKMSKADIMAIKDTGERQRAIAQNHELFGF